MTCTLIVILLLILRVPNVMPLDVLWGVAFDALRAFVSDALKRPNYYDRFGVYKEGEEE
jgi:hypothetical protein